jgi:hypothetical protein
MVVMIGVLSWIFIVYPLMKWANIEGLGWYMLSGVLWGMVCSEFDIQRKR